MGLMRFPDVVGPLTETRKSQVIMIKIGSSSQGCLIVYRGFRESERLAYHNVPQGDATGPTRKSLACGQPPEPMGASVCAKGSGRAGLSPERYVLARASWLGTTLLQTARRATVPQRAMSMPIADGYNAMAAE